MDWDALLRPLIWIWSVWITVSMIRDTVRTHRRASRADVWQGRAERWKEAARAYRRTAHQLAKARVEMTMPPGTPPRTTEQPARAVESAEEFYLSLCEPKGCYENLDDRRILLIQERDAQIRAAERAALEVRIAELEKRAKRYENAAESFNNARHAVMTERDAAQERAQRAEEALELLRLLVNQIHSKLVFMSDPYSRDLALLLEQALEAKPVAAHADSGGAG